MQSVRNCCADWQCRSIIARLANIKIQSMWFSRLLGTYGRLDRQTEWRAGRRGEASRCILGSAGLRRCRNKRKYWQALYMFRNIYLTDFVSYLLVNSDFYKLMKGTYFIRNEGQVSELDNRFLHTNPFVIITSNSTTIPHHGINISELEI